MNEEDYQDNYNPAFHGGMGTPAAVDASILSMRWENQQLISELWLSLANKNFNVDPETGAVTMVTANPLAKPLMNDIGASHVIQLIRSSINAVTSLSNLHEEDAKRRWNKFAKTIMKSLVLNKSEYGIKSLAELLQIREIIYTLTFSQSMRSVKGFEAQRSTTSTSEVRQDSTQQITQQKRGGWVGRIMGR